MKAFTAVSMTPTPLPPFLKWTRRSGRLAKTTAIAFTRCLMFEMSSIKPIIEAIKNTEIAARYGGSKMLPASFSIPMTSEREIVNANTAAIPPSSGTWTSPGLFTSLPTIPPCRIFLISPGSAMTAIARENVNAIPIASRSIWDAGDRMSSREPMFIPSPSQRLPLKG